MRAKAVVFNTCCIMFGRFRDGRWRIQRIVARVS
jgi:hypothetical protein